MFTSYNQCGHGKQRKEVAPLHALHDAFAGERPPDQHRKDHAQTPSQGQTSTQNPVRTGNDGVIAFGALRRQDHDEQQGYRDVERCLEIGLEPSKRPADEGVQVERTCTSNVLRKSKTVFKGSETSPDRL